MKKILTGILALTLMVGVFTGCTPSNKANDKDEQGRTVISVGNWPTETDKDYFDLINKQKEEFEKDNPTMAITPDTWTFDLQTFYSKAAAGQLPDLYYSNFTEIEKIKAGEYYTDLTEGLKRAGYEGKINPAVLELISDNGEIISFPTNAYALGLAYNVDLFEKAGLMNEDGTPKQPKTWDEVVEFGKIINEKTGKHGFILPTMQNFGGWLFTPVAWSYGVEFMKNEGDGKYTASFDDEKFVSALQYVSDLKWKHNIFGENALIDSTEYYKQFALGNVGMIIAAADFGGQVKQYDMPIEHMGIMPIPSGPEKHVTLTGGYMATLADGATEDQVDVFIKWLEYVGSGMDVTNPEDMEKNYQLTIESGGAIGIMGLSVFSEDAPINRYKLELVEKYRNINPNHVKLYNDSMTDTSIELRPEEPECAQELYAVIDGLLQEVLTNKDADIPALVKAANKDFQANHLDNLD